VRTDKYAKKRAALMTKFIDWEWHFRRDGTVWIRNKDTDQIKEIGKIEP